MWRVKCINYRTDEVLFLTNKHYLDDQSEATIFPSLEAAYNAYRDFVKHWDGFSQVESKYAASFVYKDVK